MTDGSRSAIFLAGVGAVLFSAVALKKRIDARQWLAMGVAYAGVTLVFLHDVRLDGERAALGGILVLMAAVSYAVYLIRAGEIVNRVGSIRLVAYASTSATFFCVAQSLIRNPQGLVTQPAEVYGLSLLNASLCMFVPTLLTVRRSPRVAGS